MSTKSTTQSSGKRKRREDNETEEQYQVQCTLCTLMFSPDGIAQLNSNAGFNHHTETQLLACATRGFCTLCRFFASQTGDLQDTRAVEKPLTFRNKGSGPAGHTKGIDVLCVNLPGLSDDIKIYPFAEAGVSGKAAEGLVRRRPLERNVCGDLVLASAKERIRNCLGLDGPGGGHGLCRHSKDRVLPYRILALRRENGCGIKVRLQINRSETPGSYLALSYCWGNTNSTKRSYTLNKDNIATFEANIHVERLPQSIKDAIQITLQLGYGYLWVDALCILQDDPIDKNQEILKMATIYKNATITIAGSVSSHASKGFLRTSTNRGAPYIPRNTATITMADGQEGKIYLSMGVHIPNHPLDKRGWVLQEFMLSSRLLIFSDYELLWQCREIPLQSVTGTTNGLEYLQPLESLPWTVFKEEAEPRFGSHETEKLYLWMTIIHQYTERSLSDPEDRLRAVGGVITELETLWSDRQFFGHWRRWFVPLLSWYKPKNLQVEKRCLHRAPSWSWASVNGVIRYEEPPDKECAKVKALSMTKMVLAGCLLKADDIEEVKAKSIVERPDLISSAAMREIGEEECSYVLLGQYFNDSKQDQGIGLLVMEVARGQYRRIGLATFADMGVWKGVQEQDVVFE